MFTTEPLCCPMLGTYLQKKPQRGFGYNQSKSFSETGAKKTNKVEENDSTATESSTILPESLKRQYEITHPNDDMLHRSDNCNLRFYDILMALSALSCCIIVSTLTAGRIVRIQRFRWG